MLNFTFRSIFIVTENSNVITLLHFQNQLTYVDDKNERKMNCVTHRSQEKILIVK